jgi:hypothetical protein
VKIFIPLNTTSLDIKEPSDYSFLLDMVKTNSHNCALLNLEDNSFQELDLSIKENHKTIIDKPDKYPVEILGFSDKTLKPENDYFKVIRFEKKGNRWNVDENDMLALGENVKIEIAENIYKIIKDNVILFETEDKSYDNNGKRVRKNSIDAGFRNVYTYTIGNDIHILRIRNADLENNKNPDYIEFAHFILKTS